jgi:hypothetical protein
VTPAAPSCTPTSLFVLLGDDERRQLRSSSQASPLIVRYEDCRGTLLAQCRAPGRYSSQSLGVEHLTRTFDSRDELSAVLLGEPITNSAPSSLTQATIETWASRLATLEASAEWQTKLAGRCDGATHFVRSFAVGAARMSLVGADDARATTEVGLPETCGGGPKPAASNAFGGIPEPAAAPAPVH